jgi:hypothetical protein
VPRFRLPTAVAIAAVSIAVAATDLNADSIPEPVSYWPADGNTNDIVGGVNGVLAGNASYTTGCTGLRFDGAFSLDGAGSYVNIPGSENGYTYTDRITVLAWIRAGGTQLNGTQNDYAGIITKGDNTWWLAVWSPTRNSPPRYDVLYFGVGVGPFDYQDAVGVTSIHDGKWHLAAGVYDGSAASLYLDGQLQTQTLRGHPLPTGGYPIQIGNNAQVSGRYFAGILTKSRSGAPL